LEDELLSTIQNLNSQIKGNIKAERKRIISLRLTSGNTKAFWHQIKQLEGKI